MLSLKILFIMNNVLFYFFLLINYLEKKYFLIDFSES